MLEIKSPIDSPTVPPPAEPPTAEWKRLDRINDPRLAIQLCDLLSLYKKLEREEDCNAIKFAFCVAENKDTDWAEDILGKLIFRVSCMPHESTDYLDASDLCGSAARLNQLMGSFKQPRDSMDLSWFLITRNGEVNFGLIPFLKQICPKHHPNLDLLYKSHALRRKIETFAGPWVPEGAALIRRVTHIPADKQVHTVHARIALTSALLTPHRQQEIGSCFSTSICIQQQIARPERCVEDWTSLLKRGYIERKVGNQVREFPYTPSLHPSPDDHPLLAAWDHCVAAMAEAEEDGVITKRLVHCLRSGLLSRTGEVLQHCDEVEKRLHDAVIATVVNRRSYRYIDGAFYLIDRSADEKVICNAPQFVDFLRSCLAATPEEPEDSFYMAGLTHLRTSLDESIIEHYPNDDSKGHTPWLDLASNNPRPVIKTFLELSELPKQIELKPKRAEQLLAHIIDFVRDAPQGLTKRVQNKPAALVPVSTQSHHAFSLRFGSPQLLKAWTAIYPPYTQHWIQQHLVDPGRTVARQQIPQATRSEVLKRLELPDVFPEVSDITDFRDRLLQMTKFKADTIDTIIVEELPEEVRTELTQRAIPFADSNWHRDGHPLDFVFIFNPCADKLEMWEADDLGHFQALDQEEWLTKREWVLYPDCFKLMA